MKKLVIPLVALAVVMLATSIAKRNRRQKLPCETGPRIAATSDDLCVKSER
jgi:hypothetical protein